MLATLATEYCLVFIALTLILLLTGIFKQKHRLAGTVIGIIAILLFSTPIIRAYVVADNLNQNFTTAFIQGSTIINGDDNEHPFIFWNLFKGNREIAFKEITYNKYPDPKLTLNYYPSQIVGKRPCIVVVHGGSWNKGDNTQLPELNSYLAIRGYNVASINYRLAPHYKSPAQVDDVHSAIKYLRMHANALFIDTNNFVLLGRSAGGQIALLAAYTLHEKGLKAVIDYYGPADLVWGYAVPSNPLVMNSRKVLSDYIGGTYAQVPQKFVASSPVDFVSESSVPTLMLHGDNDVLVSPEHSRRLNQKLAKYGVRHFLLKLPWATHGFDYNLQGPGGQLATYTVLRFLNTVTK